MGTRTFTFGPFVLEADIGKTERLYKKAPFITQGCSCDGCRSFMRAAGVFPGPVKEFFRSLGIDIRKAAEVYTISGPDETAEGLTAHYGGFCHLCGTLVKQNPEACYTIAEGYNVRFTDAISLPEEGLEGPAVQIELDFCSVPWYTDMDV